MADHPHFLNLGCGRNFSSSPEWINLDIDPTDKAHVTQYQLLLGIPFADNTFHAVYHSHMLEHFPRNVVPAFLRECLRVLIPGGILRIALPDVESILRIYLNTLDAARHGEDGAQDRLLWMQIELFDQMTRQQSGGLMADAWQKADDQLEKFIRTRIGTELDNIPRHSQPSPLKLLERPLGFSLPDINFLSGGELHRWMYDSYSLQMLLEEAGFVNVKSTLCHTESLGGFQPDCDAEGLPRKPDSLYMEAQKPENDEKNTPNIALFMTKDSGGAGIAALRLHEGLRKNGVPSVVYVQHKTGNESNLYVLPENSERILHNEIGESFLSSASHDWQDQARVLAKWPNRPQDWEMFSTSLASPRLENVPLIDHFDILHFHWIAGFLDVPANTHFLKGKKIVWTLHDMNAFTGGCHYAKDCTGYLRQCGNCPQLGSDTENDLSRQTWKRRFYAYKNLDLTIVTPSHWLAEKARQSSLFGNFPIHYIPYGLPLDIFKPLSQKTAKATLNIPEDGKTLLFCADSVLNKRKGLQYLLDALTLLYKNNSEKTQNLTLLLLGSHGENLSLPFPVKALGNVKNPVAMAWAYSAADIVVLPSLEDNLPNVLLEAQACGTPAVAFDAGGIPEIVEEGRSGWLTPAKDVEKLALCLEKALEQAHTLRLSCRARALENYPLHLQAQRYQELYQQLTSTLTKQANKQAKENTMQQVPSPDSANLDAVKKLRREAADALNAGDIQKAQYLLSQAKGLKIPLESIDYLRAMTFLRMKDINSAIEALKEELRYFPNNQAANALLEKIDKKTEKNAINLIHNNSFQALYQIVRPYTMVGEQRLFALYTHALEVCGKTSQGSFVECGVCAGGSSGLISAVIKQYAPSRQLFACDSYSGMPPASEFDVHAGQNADATGWGAGTCAAPESSVQELCEKLGTTSILTTVKGYFEDTLPVWKEKFGSIAFLHMDGDWYESTKTILENLYDQLMLGAYVQIDDFGHWEGCRKAVLDFFQSRGLNPTFHPIDATGVWFEKEGSNKS